MNFIPRVLFEFQTRASDKNLFISALIWTTMTKADVKTITGLVCTCLNIKGLISAFHADVSWTILVFFAGAFLSVCLFVDGYRNLPNK